MGHSKDSPERKVIAMSACIKKTERSQINDLMIHPKLLEKQEQANPKTPCILLYGHTLFVPSEVPKFLTSLSFP
jgi:hypothetical protein